MKRSIILHTCLLLLLGCNFSQAQVEAPRPVIIGYVGGYRGLANIDIVKAKQLDIINYAFVDIKDNRAWLHREATDTINFRRLNLLKKQNPGLKVLISIGGWTWSGRFSDAVLTDTSRNKFAQSAVSIIQKYDLDGIDIDWEYPGKPGFDGNVYRPEDKQNYTLLFKVLRAGMDSLQAITHKKYLLSTAVGASASYVEHTEMGSVQQYLDYINLMTYDYSGGKIAGHHTNLYASKSYQSPNNASNAVADFIAAGVPATKLVMGIAFYGRVANLVSNAKGIGDTVATYSRNKGYTTIKDSLSKTPGNKTYRDRDAKAPYLYNNETKLFISYDDEWSVRYKCRFVKKNKLAGVMFWEYDSDPKGYLLEEINRDLKR